jgi:hypothetical protein
VPDFLTVTAILYGLGIVLTLLWTDAPPLARIGLALVWPVGPLAGLVTILVLVATAAVAFPLFGVLVLGAALAVWWSFG